MTKVQARFDYPKPDQTRIGIKVRWYYYADKAKADEAAAIAKKEAPVREAQGYDFGYQSPGVIRGIDNGFFPGLYEVCLP